MADAYLPAGWPEAVAPPGSEDFVPSAVDWLYDLVPDLRGHTTARYPAALAASARHVTAGAVDGARAGYRTARTELGEAIPPHAVDTALTAYRDKGAAWQQPRKRRNWWNARCAASPS
jgi:hypothetical protein